MSMMLQHTDSGFTRILREWIDFYIISLIEKKEKKKWKMKGHGQDKNKMKKG